MAEYQRSLAKYGEAHGIRRNLVENCEILTESGRKERNLAEFGEIWQNILKIKKLRNVAKFEKNDEVWQNLSMKWRNVAEYQRNLAKYDEPPAKYGDIWREKAKF